MIVGDRPERNNQLNPGIKGVKTHERKHLGTSLIELENSGAKFPEFGSGV
jgi:hypothetical protein